MATEQQLDYGEDGLGLAEAAGLTPGAEEAYDFFGAFWHYFYNDLISSIPITIASILVLLVIIERAIFYNKNNRDVYSFIQRLQHQLEKGELENALMLCGQLGSVVGDVAEEGVRLLAVQKEDFAKAYDVTVNIETRKLERYLPILATVGAVAPFLGLFGTVSGVIKALFKMSLGAEGASLSMIGEISNALIATGYGLAIAILAVVLNNIFNNIVKRYEDDFLLLKLLFLSFTGVDFNALKREAVLSRMENPQVAPTQAPQQAMQQQQAHQGYAQQAAPAPQNPQAPAQTPNQGDTMGGQAGAQPGTQAGTQGISPSAGGQEKAPPYPDFLS